MTELRLHPSGRLILDGAPDGPLATAFARDWREGLFTLAAMPRDGDDEPEALSLRFWREVAAHLLSRLCHLPPGSEAVPPLTPPAPERLAAWCEGAPPFAGAEYLGPGLLAGIWDQLVRWTGEAAATAGGVSRLLETRAPAWRRVGRVTFNLADNRRDSARPFAFMASFTTGMDAAGNPRHLPLGRALERYAGADDRPALIRLLEPVSAAARSLDWVRELVESGEIYRPVAWSPRRAHLLLDSVPQLDAAGVVVRLPEWSRRLSRPRVTLTVGDREESLLGADAILSCDVSVTLDGERLSPEDLGDLLATDEPLVRFKGRWVEVDRDRLEAARRRWQGTDGAAGHGAVSFHEGLRLLAGAPADLREDDPDLDAGRDWTEVVAGAGLRDTLAAMRAPHELAAPPVGEDLAGILRPYQQEGIAWLELLTGLGLGACLADDMGLGKTLQVLALLRARRRRRAADGAEPPGPSLLVAPASLLGNWREEAARFTSDLTLSFLHPAFSGREALAAMASRPQETLDGADLAITTYGMAHRLDWLREVPWDLLILDEAQAIKNPRTRQARAIRRLRSRARVALTGTPIENSLADLWSLFDVLDPGLLGTTRVFQNFVASLQRRPEASFEPLRRLVSPYILRRLKTDRAVIADLPEKTEQHRYCQLTAAQARLYRKVVDDLARTLASTDQGLERRGAVLQALLHLKQVCNHPSQFSGDGQWSPTASGKFVQLAAVADELAARQDRVLVFTQFREVMPPLADHLASAFGRPGLVLHGDTPVRRRAELVERFQADDGPPFLIVSLRAGGTGLNLTAAAHVIHFDRWWNPAVENQATDRAFRIGQKRNVLVQKFVTTGTIEERIDQLIGRKQALAEELLAGAGEVKLTELADEELLQLVRLDITAQER
jgi:non-specific serine/threonine protein kinase